MSSAQGRGNTEGFFGEVFLKVWKFSTQLLGMKKKKFLIKRYRSEVSHTCFAALGKQPELLSPNFVRKCSGSEKKLLEPRKKKKVLFHILHALSKTLLKPIPSKPRTLKLTVQKSLNLWKKVSKLPVLTKIGEWRTLPENFAQSMKVSRSKYLIKKCFSRKKIPSCSFANVFCSFEISANFFTQTAGKICSESDKIVTFLRKKKLERSFAHIEGTFKNTVETFFIDARNICSNSPKK